MQQATVQWVEVPSDNQVFKVRVIQVCQPWCVSERGVETFQVMEICGGFHWTHRMVMKLSGTWTQM